MASQQERELPEEFGRLSTSIALAQENMLNARKRFEYVGEEQCRKELKELRAKRDEVFRRLLEEGTVLRTAPIPDTL